MILTLNSPDDEPAGSVPDHRVTRLPYSHTSVVVDGDYRVRMTVSGFLLLAPYVPPLIGFTDLQ